MAISNLEFAVAKLRNCPFVFLGCASHLWCPLNGACLSPLRAPLSLYPADRTNPVTSIDIRHARSSNTCAQCATPIFPFLNSSLTRKVQPNSRKVQPHPTPAHTLLECIQSAEMSEPYSRVRSPFKFSIHTDYRWRAGRQPIYGALDYWLSTGL